MAPRPKGAAVAMAAPPVEDEAEVEAEEEEELLDEDEVVSVEVEVGVELEVVKDLELLREADEVKLRSGVTTGEDRPAGIEAAGCCEVTTAGWLVTAAACEVTASGWPVTTPRELVSVRY